MIHNYQDRIRELTSAGEEEGITLREGTLTDFSEFIKALDHANSEPQRAGLILTHDGCICAIWQSGDGRSRVEVEFHGERQSRTVTFKEYRAPLTTLPEIATNNLDAAADMVRRMLGPAANRQNIAQC